MRMVEGDWAILQNDYLEQRNYERGKWQTTNITTLYLYLYYVWYSDYYIMIKVNNKIKCCFIHSIVDTFPLVSLQFQWTYDNRQNITENEFDKKKKEMCTINWFKSLEILCMTAVNCIDEKIDSWILNNILIINSLPLHCCLKIWKNLSINLIFHICLFLLLKFLRKLQSAYR